MTCRDGHMMSATLCLNIHMDVQYEEPCRQYRVESAARNSNGTFPYGGIRTMCCESNDWMKYKAVCSFHHCVICVMSQQATEVCTSQQVVRSSSHSISQPCMIFFDDVCADARCAQLTYRIRYKPHFVDSTSIAKHMGQRH